MAKRADEIGSAGWRPDGLEILDVTQQFPDTEIEALAAYLPRVSDMVSFRIGVLNAVGIYRLNLHYNLGPRGSDRRRVLADMLCQAKALEQAIEALDLHSRIALEVAAGEDPSDPGLEPDNLPDPGRTRVRCAKDGLPRLQRWAEIALKNTDPSPHGRPRQYAEREVVAMLRALWEEQSGKPATLISPSMGRKHGPFLSFCQQILWLISDERGVRRLDLTKAVQDVLYPAARN